MESDKPAEPEQVYPVSDLLANAQAIFGQPSYVVAGALAFGGYAVEATKSEIATAINGFLRQKDKSHVQGGN